MGIFNFKKKDKNPDENQINSDSYWTEKLKDCNFLFMKDVMKSMLQLAYNEGKAKGGAYAMEKGLMEFITKFIDNPCLETAIPLAKTSPKICKIFEDSKVASSFKQWGDTNKKN